MRKSKIPTPLQKLSDDQLAEVHSWFKRHSYDEILAQLRTRFAIEMSRSQLGRYYQRFAEAHLFNAVLHTPLTPADMLAIKCADPISDLVNRDALQKHTLRLVRQPNITVSALKLLHDVATYDQRRRLTEREQELEEKQLALRERFQDYRRQLRALKPNIS